MTEPLRVLDTALGDRVVNAALIAAILGEEPGLTVAALFASPLALGDVAPAAVHATTFDTTGLATLDSVKLDTGTKTATGSGGTSTLNKMAGVITTESLNTAAGATYTETISNDQVAATDQVFASVTTAGNGTPVVAKVTPGASSIAVVIQNIHASAAFSAALKIAFMVLKN